MKCSGKAFAIPPDDDGTGRSWSEHVCKQAADVSTDARIVRLPLDKSNGLKDVGDFILRMYENGKDSGAVAASLDEHYRRSDPWYGASINELWSSGRMWAPVTYVRTGLRALDSATGGGLRTRGVTMLVGKTNQAKSQLAVAIVVNAARAGTPTGFFSLELGADEVAQLVAAQLGDIPRHALATDNLLGEHPHRLLKATTDHREMPLYILDDERWPGGITCDAMGTLVADGVKRFGWRLVILDYLGLVVSSEADQFQADILISGALRKLARRHDLALVVVAALRKSQAVRHTEPSNLSIDDVAGAGRLAYDAQNVLLVWRNQGDDDSGIVHVRPLKMRYSPMKDEVNLQFRWRPSTGLITDLEGVK
jgi:replicative DNA helicase